MRVGEGFRFGQRRGEKIRVHSALPPTLRKEREGWGSHSVVVSAEVWASPPRRSKSKSKSTATSTAASEGARSTRENARDACASRAPWLNRDRCRYLDGGNVLRLPAFGAFGHVELDGLAFLQALEAARLNRGEMHENVFAILTADEAVAFGVVKPLHCSLFCH